MHDHWKEWLVLCDWTEERTGRSAAVLCLGAPSADLSYFHSRCRAVHAHTHGCVTRPRAGLFYYTQLRTKHRIQGAVAGRTRTGTGNAWIISTKRTRREVRM